MGKKKKIRFSFYHVLLQSSCRQIDRIREKVKKIIKISHQERYNKLQYNYTILTFDSYIMIKVKFLKSKEGSAMVQLGDPISVERAIANLSNAFFFGNKLQLR